MEPTMVGQLPWISISVCIFMQIYLFKKQCECVHNAGNPEQSTRIDCFSRDPRPFGVPPLQTPHRNHGGCGWFTLGIELEPAMFLGPFRLRLVAPWEFCGIAIWRQIQEPFMIEGPPSWKTHLTWMEDDPPVVFLCIACCFGGHDLWWILISCELLPFSRAMQVHLTPHFATAACGLPRNSKTLIHNPFPCSIHFQHGRWIMVIQPCLGILIGRSMGILPVVDGEGMTIPHQGTNLTTFQCSMSRTVQTDVPTNVTQCRRYDMNGTYNSTPWMLVKPCKNHSTGWFTQSFP